MLTRSASGAKPISDPHNSNIERLGPTGAFAFWGAVISSPARGDRVVGSQAAERQFADSYLRGGRVGSMRGRTYHRKIIR